MKINSLYTYLLLVAMLLAFTSCSRVKRDHWENGELKSELPYKGGKLNGIARWYYEDGVIQLEVPYVNDVIEGVNIRYHDNGRKASEETFVNNLRHGKAVEYSYAGKRVEQMYYENDTLHGPYRKWHGNGVLQISGELINGLYEGTWLYYNDYGELIGEGKYKAGEGIQRFWNPDGSLRSRTSYKHNEKHGMEYHYLPDGSLDFTAEYDHGELLSGQQD